MAEEDVEALAKKIIQTEAQVVLANCSHALTKMLLPTPNLASDALEAAFKGSGISRRVGIIHGEPKQKEASLCVIRATGKDENGLTVWVVPDIAAARIHFTLPSDRQQEE